MDRLTKAGLIDHFMKANCPQTASSVIDRLYDSVQHPEDSDGLMPVVFVTGLIKWHAGELEMRENWAELRFKGWPKDDPMRLPGNFYAPGASLKFNGPAGEICKIG